MIYKKAISFIISYFFIFYIFFISGKIIINNELKALEKFEGLIVSVNSNVLTTYDLSQRIKLALKALGLEDTISNRDTVRERVLELLIIEKIKKSEAIKENIDHTEDELVDFASMLYNFPKEQYEEFKTFIKKENQVDIDILMEQLSSELMWKKLLQRKFSSKIVISKQEVDKIFKEKKKKQGKYEYNFTEVFFENKSNQDWSESKKELKNFISLLEQGISFNNLAEKYGYGTDSNTSWTIEDNLDKKIKKTLSTMKIGQVSGEIKVDDGYKIIKLNKKRIFGNQKLKYSFIKISSFEIEKLDFSKFSSISCADDEYFINDDISASKINNIFADEMVNIYLEKLEKLEVGRFSTVVDYNNQFSVLKLCDKKDEIDEVQKRKKIENKLYAQKYNQLANTFIANLRQNANIKYFNK